MRVYYDTSVVSGIARSDMKTEDLSATKEIAKRARSGAIALHSSTAAKEEIHRIPPKFRARHEAEYKALDTIRGSTAWLDENHPTPDDDPDFRTLSSILHDRNDARHLWLAKKAGISEFITVDQRTILSKATELRATCGMYVRSPSDFITAHST